MVSKTCCRTYIFRGKREYDGEWVYGSLIMAENYCCILEKEEDVHPVDYPYLDGEIGWIDGKATPVDPKSIGLNTGLVDGDGFLIYEGDIVEFESHGYISEKYVGVVIFKDGCCGIEYLQKWYREHGWDSLFHRIGKTEEWRDMGASGTITYTYCVLGNVHDNPEFLDMWAE